MGQGHGGTQLLVGVLGIDPQAHVGFDRLVELGGGVGLHQLNGLDRGIGPVIDLGGQFGIALGNVGHGRNGVRANRRHAADAQGRDAAQRFWRTDLDLPRSMGWMDGRGWAWGLSP